MFKKLGYFISIMSVTKSFYASMERILTKQYYILDDVYSISELGEKSLDIDNIYLPFDKEDLIEDVNYYDLGCYLLKNDWHIKNNKGLFLPDYYI